MEKEPLLPYLSPRKTPPLLCPLPEDDEFSLPVPLTPSGLKERLIFGPSPANGDPIVEALTLSLNSPRPSTSNQDFSFTAVPETPQQQQQQQQQQSWLIDPNYSWKKTNLHRSKTAPAMAVINDLKPPDITQPKFGSQSIVRQAVILLVLYLSFGVLIYSINRHHFSANETHPVVDALYFCIVTMCTIGYGDITPNSTATKLFSILFVLVGFGFIDILLSGMVSYVLDLQESYLLKNLKDVRRVDKKEPPNSYIFDLKKGRMRIRMKVGLALGVVVLCIGVGVAVMHFVESLGWLDALYLSVMSVTTVGYGDRAFHSLAGRLFASIWLLVSTLAVARAFLYLAEARVDKRHRMMAKFVLGQTMTVSQFLAADLDNNGFVSKSEYVIYKLKEMGKISEKDILPICQQFDRLDAGNCGKITLADLMEGQP
ncbi:cAMP-dependent protein kinase catalytic subunit tpk3 [Turnera subulata]|uniref:cAMP-dependent protein kinase catalytic subunit tpk3 n=1 Tax=Turnera subulata TaxID=218843 RepID=A0A9Q0F836_9ROSI|nr:cAMP-dependent protein kinase catalytic subunit tpk3 [Turnera subulata]